MSAVPFAVGAEVTVSLSGEWERLRGTVLRVASITRASTYLGGWAVRLEGPMGLDVPTGLVGSAWLVPLPRESGVGTKTPTIVATVDSAIIAEEAVRMCERLTQRVADMERQADALRATVDRLGELLATVIPTASPRDMLRHAGVEAIADDIAARYACSVEQICSRGRQQHVVSARGELLVALRDHDPKQWSYPALSRLVGTVNSGVWHAIQRQRARTLGRSLAA